MITLKDAVEDFLSQERIAVSGVSGTREDAANNIYRKLRQSGHTVYAVNPGLEKFGDDPCYPDLASIPEKVDGVVIVTRPEITEQIVRQCAELGIPRVWMHRSMEMLGSSVSDEAVEFCKHNGITVIPGGCPMMFQEPVDIGHKCMRWVLNITGKLPEQV